MFKYLIAFTLLTPLIGIALVEAGSYAPSIGQDGHPNGATIAFAIYAAGVLLFSLAVIWGRQYSTPSPSAHQSTYLQDKLRYTSFGYRLLLLNTFFLLIMVFGFNALGVLTGSIGKGEFRANLGSFGALAYLMTKYIAPASLAYLGLLFQATQKTSKEKLLLLGNIIIVFAIGITWGFKTTAMAMLLPMIVLLYWKISVATLMRFIAIFLVVIAALFFTFDSEREGTTDVIGFLFARLTIIQGDVSWGIWNSFQNGDEFPPYAPTLLAGVGDSVLSTFGGSPSDEHEWMLLHYDWMISYLAGIPLDVISDGHSIVGTPFSEGIVFNGYMGIGIFSALAGILTGLIYRIIGNSIRSRNHMTAALSSTYFCFVLFPWLTAGGIAQTFHIANVVGILISSVFIIVIRSRTRQLPFKSRSHAF